METRSGTRKKRLLLLLAFLFGPLGGPALDRAAGQELSKGQLIYVPIYSHIYYGDREKALLLTATLSIRNIDPTRSLTC